MKELQARLIKELSDLVSHLNQYEEHIWSANFSRVQKLIDNGDRRGLDLIKSMRGGMGSFTDLVICQINGHHIERKQEDFANKELMRLGSLVFATADKLNKELNKRVPNKSGI